MSHNVPLDPAARNFFAPATLAGATKYSVAPTVADAFVAAMPPFHRFCREIEVDDFRPHRITTPSGDDADLQLQTLGKVTALTKVDLVNGDAPAFFANLRALGECAARQMMESLITTLFTGRGLHFNAANRNLLQGPASALSPASFARAIELLARTGPGQEVPADRRPRVLLVPVALGDEARALVESAVYPELAVLTYTPPEGMAGAWSLFTGAERAPVVLARLRGSRYLNVAACPDEIVPLRWRVYIDFVFGLGDPSAAVLSVGQ